MKNAFFLLVPMSLLFSGCSDDLVLDVRDKALGIYDYKIRFYSLSGSDIYYYGQQFDEFSTLKVEKDPGDGNSIVIDDAPDLFFSGNQVIAGSNGFTFEVPHTTKTAIGGDTYIVEGYPGFDVDGVKHHGFYNAIDKTLSVWVKETQPKGVIVLEVIGTPAQD